MKNKSNTNGFIVAILLGLIALIVIVGVLYFYSSKKVDAPIVDNNIINTEILGNKDDLVSFSVQPGDTVSGLLNLSGSVKNAYFFEANIRVILLDASQNILKEGFGTATTDWMTVDPVSFTSTIDATGFSGAGYILIQNDDPSDGEGGPAKKIFIPVIFQ